MPIVQATNVADFGNGLSLRISQPEVDTMEDEAIRWLHITDIFASRDEDNGPARTFRAIADAAKKKKAEGFVPDFVFVTGDLADKGMSEDYDAFNSTVLFYLTQAFGSGIESRIFTVPGNHDVDRSKHSGFNRTALLARDHPFFAENEQGWQERAIVLARFEGFRDFIKDSSTGDWLNTTSGCWTGTYNLHGTAVGIVLINTSWLSAGTDDDGKLTPGFLLVKSAIEKIETTELRIVIGHHPLRMFEPDEQSLLQDLFRRQRVIYLHGHVREPETLRPKFDEWPIIIRGLSVSRAEDREENLNGILWGQVLLKKKIIRLYPQRMVDSTVQGGEYSGLAYADKEIELRDEPVQEYEFPSDSASNCFEPPLAIAISSTRYTRRTDGNHLIYEHALRAADKDIGVPGLRRSAMKVDESLSFFNKLVLIGSHGSGKTFAINRLYNTLTRAFKANDPTIIHDQYPDWRHAPLPMPFRIDGPAFYAWLVSDRSQAISTVDGNDLPLIHYATNRSNQLLECCPAPDARVLKAHCYRESCVLLVDDWHALSSEEATTVRAEIDKMAMIESKHRPAVIYAIAPDSAADNEFFSSDFERINIADIDNDTQSSFVTQFCTLNGLHAKGFQSILAGLRPLVTTPGALLAVLREWQRLNSSEPLPTVSNVLDAYTLEIDQCFACRFEREQAFAILQQVRTASLKAFLQDPATIRLSFNIGSSEWRPDELVNFGFLRWEDYNTYSIRQVPLQDFIVGSELAKYYDYDLEHILRHLLATFRPRREPIKIALLSVVAAGHSGEKLDRALALLLSRDSDPIATVAAADYIIGQGEKPAISLLSSARKQFAVSFMNHRLTPLDRFVISRALATCGDPRPGTGLEVPSQLGIPDITWLHIRSGEARLGAREDDIKVYEEIPDSGVHPGGEPAHDEHIDGFWLSKYLVTQQQFNEFIKDKIYGYETSYPWKGLQHRKKEDLLAPSLANHPMTGLWWDEAKAFCRWYTRISGREVDLPDSKRWEYAARGAKDTRLFPYEGSKRFGYANTQEEGLPGVTAVGAFPLSDSPFGVSDMCGNVFEWCDDVHQDDNKDYKVTKGGSYNHDVLRCRNAIRGKKHRTSKDPYMGFRLISSGEPKKKKRIVLVGGGFSGSCTAIRLLALANQPVEIVIVEQQQGREFGGVAYSQDTAHWEHLFNLQAGRISLYREDRDDFVKWLKAADNRTWNARYRDTLTGMTDLEARSRPVPRCLYQQYLEERLREAATGAHPHVSLRLVFGTVVDVLANPNRVVICDSEKQRFELECAQLVLCTGNLQIKCPPCLEHIHNHANYIEDQYSPGAREKFKKLQPGHKVLVVGSGLRAYDVVMTLDSGYTEIRRSGVQVVLMSRNGREHPAYEPTHMHMVLRVAPPGFLETAGPAVMLREEFVAAVYEAFKAACISPDLHDVTETLRSERILKAWEQYVPRAIKMMDKADVRELLREYKSLITVRRIGVVPEIAQVIQRAKKDKTCRVVAAEIKSIVAHDGRWNVTYRRKDAQTDSRPEDFDLIVNATGREQDYSKLEDALWQALFDKGMTIRHDLTGIGIDVDRYGMLIDANGESSDWISAVGVMREGTEFERHGRLGSFSFTLGPLKNQAIETAVYLLRRLNARANPPYTIRERMPQRGGSGVDILVDQCLEHAWTTVFSTSGNIDGSTLQIPQDEVWSLAVDRIKTRRHEDRQKLMDREARLHEAVRRALRLRGVDSDELQSEFTEVFECCLEEIALAHLTRLDEVEPGETPKQARGRSLSETPDQGEERLLITIRKLSDELYTDRPDHRQFIKRLLAHMAPGKLTKGDRALLDGVLRATQLSDEFVRCLKREGILLNKELEARAPLKLQDARLLWEQSVAYLEDASPFDFGGNWGRLNALIEGYLYRDVPNELKRHTSDIDERVRAMENSFRNNLPPKLSDFDIPSIYRPIVESDSNKTVVFIENTLLDDILLNLFTNLKHAVDPERNEIEASLHLRHEEDPKPCISITMQCRTRSADPVGPAKTTDALAQRARQYGAAHIVNPPETGPGILWEETWRFRRL